MCAHSKRVAANELPFSLRSRRFIKAVLLDEQGNKCLHCSNFEWLGLPITLELDHIDGNNKNNIRENLRLLCPNCHAQTPTWRKAKSHPRWKNNVPEVLQGGMQVS